MTFVAIIIVLVSVSAVLALGEKLIGLDCATIPQACLLGIIAALLSIVSGVFIYSP